MSPGAFRRWWKSPGVRAFRRRISDLQKLLYPVIAVITRTWVWVSQRGIRYDRRGPIYDYIRERTPCIVVFWHQDPFVSMFDICRFWSVYPTLFMVSGGRVGELGTYLLHWFHSDAVRGSSAQGGIPAIEELTRRAREGNVSVFLTGDGSRGPAFRMKWGPLYLARDSGLPIIGVRGWGNNLVVFKRTWMQLAVPKPWGRNLVLSSEPLFVPSDADKAALEACRRELDARMNALVTASLAYFSEGLGVVSAFGAPHETRALFRSR